MIPVLYTIGSFNVYSFGIFLAIAFILSTFIVWKLSREEFKEEEHLDAYFYTALVTLIVGRTVYILRNWQDFKFIILKYFLVVETPGLSMLGGAVGGIIFLYFYCKRKKINFYHMGDLFAVASSLGLVFIKIGQQLGGAAFGKQTDFFLKVKILGRAGFYHPAELYESLIYTFLFVILLVFYKRGLRKKWHSGIIFSLFVLVVSLSTIILEFIKVYRVYLYGLSFRQLLGILIFIVTTVFLSNRIGFIKKLLNFFKKTNHEVSKRNS